jgi:hypothetical protein
LAKKNRSKRSSGRTKGLLIKEIDTILISLVVSRMINKAIRELEKEIKNLERSAKKLEGDIKKAGRENQIV